MTDTTVARTILEQLGGRAFLLMTGAKALTAHSDSLSFRFPLNAAGKPNYCCITLTPADTYTVEFAKCYRRTAMLVSKHTDIYAEDLPALFRRVTGLETRLPRLHMTGMAHQ